MEIILAMAIATMVTTRSVKNSFVDAWWEVVRGKPSPRKDAAMKRRQARTARPRSPFAAYWADLWRDSWTDVHARHTRRRQRRAARPARPRGAFRSYAGVLAEDGWRRWDAAWDERAARRQARPRPVTPPRAPVVVPGDVTEPQPAAEDQPMHDQEWHVTQPDGTQFITDDPQTHLDRGHLVRPRHNTQPDQTVEPTTTGRNTMTTTAPIGEVTGLSTAIAGCGQAAEAAEAWGPALEQLSAGITAGGVGGGTTGRIAAAMDHIAAGAAELRAAEQELIAQLGVKEAYDATPDAGEKGFVTAE